MINSLISLVNEKYPLSEIDCAEFAKMKVNGMNFSITAYRAQGLGHISVMRAKGFFGLMKMDTLIINPKEIELPLYSYDRIYAAGNDTLIVELYDTQSAECDLGSLENVKNQYGDLSDRDPGEHWYDSIKLPSSISKKGKKTQTGRLDKLATEHLSAYLNICNKAESAEEKRRKAAYYVDGLLTNGGPSTDVFKKSLGVEKTARLFKNILFGISK